MAQFDQTTASRAVLIEVANVLGAFREHFVVVGGWVPELLFPNQGHMGSLDVDLAVAATALANNAYETIRKRMLDAGYAPQTDPTRFFKNVAGAPEPVKVDMIAGQYQGGAKVDAIQVNEIQLSCLRGIDLAFTACEEIQLAGPMPDGKENVVRVRIVRPEVYILIKAFALDERANKKDAYDVAFVLQHYQPSLAELAEHLHPHVATGLGREAFEILQAKFATLNSVGPTWAAEAMIGTEEDYEQLQRGAFENAQALFRLVAAKTASA